MSVEIRRTLTPQEKREYVLQYQGFVRAVARRMAGGMPSHIETEDLVQDGMLGLMDALERCDPSRGHTFHAFVTCRIRGAMLDAVRSQDWVSRGGRRRARQVTQAQDQLSLQMGRTATHQELAQSMGLSQDEIHRRFHERSRFSLTQLDQPAPQAEAPAFEMKDDSPSLEELYLTTERRKLLLEGMKQLNPRERLIVYKYYFEGVNIRLIGAMLGVTEARISQIHSRCVRKLREYFEVRQAC